MWTSPNASQILTSSSLLIPDLATSYLAISGAGLREGATYVLGVSSYGGYIDTKVEGECLCPKNARNMRGIVSRIIESSRLQTRYDASPLVCVLQITLRVNAAPKGGTLQVSPSQGRALITAFTTM